MNGTIEQLRLRASGSNPLVSWTDEKLLLAYRFDHNTAAFEELVHRYEKELFGYLRHYLGNAEMAEDVFQQTFLQIHLKCDQFEPGRKVRPWLYTVAVNQAIDCQRRTRRHRLASLDRIAGTNEDGESGALAGLLGGSETGPAAEAESAEQSASASPGGRCAARLVPGGGDAGVFSRAQVPRGGGDSGRPGGDGQEPAARRGGEAHRRGLGREGAATARTGPPGSASHMSEISDQQLLGYLLGALDDEEQEWLDARLERDPRCREALTRWRQRLAPLSALRPEFEPPPGLARRTCRLVAVQGPVRPSAAPGGPTA